ncbi:MAG: radical SAM protein [Phycisphaeraceae bacterium]|nr:radical SAM protein [Phycisphaeraceae bacterium]
MLDHCHGCPWSCGVNRQETTGKMCHVGRHARVASFGPHHGEESLLSGWAGSGAIFFSRCNLHCVFCQNHQISQTDGGREVDARELANLMLQLQEAGCHNINLVTPQHVAPQILEALVVAAEDGLHIPLVYNTNGYDGMDALRLLDGVIDIYMPDFKCWSPMRAQRYLKSAVYPEVARLAIREMHRQVGDLVVDDRGLARRGLLVRHLVMPGQLDDTRRILHFLAEDVSPNTYLNLMDQYHPDHQVGRVHFMEINRPVKTEEMRRAFAMASEAGLTRLEGRWS